MRKLKKKEIDEFKTLYRKRDKAVERLISAWQTYLANDRAGTQLDQAVDALTMAHLAMTFNYTGLPEK
jgi:hypothetical protein